MSELFIPGRDLDADEIVSNLYQGAVPPEGDILAMLGFDLLILAASEHQPPRRRFHDISVIHAPLDDHQDPLSTEELQLIRFVGGVIADWLRDGERVLVTCHCGLNRSGMLVASALCQLGLSPGRAVGLIQQHRQGALRNQSFVRQLPLALGI